MGLDMYIMSSSKNTQKEIELAYWRKANWFHGWFVDELANGEDDCEPIHLKKEMCFLTF